MGGWDQPTTTGDQVGGWGAAPAQEEVGGWGGAPAVGHESGVGGFGGTTTNEAPASGEAAWGGAGNEVGGFGDT